MHETSASQISPCNGQRWPVVGTKDTDMQCGGDTQDLKKLRKDNEGTKNATGSCAWDCHVHSRNRQAFDASERIGTGVIRLQPGPPNQSIDHVSNPPWNGAVPSLDAKRTLGARIACLLLSSDARGNVRGMLDLHDPPNGTGSPAARSTCARALWSGSVQDKHASSFHATCSLLSHPGSRAHAFARPSFSCFVLAPSMWTSLGPVLPSFCAHACICPSVVVEFESHPVVYLVICQRDVVLVHRVPLLDPDPLWSRSRLGRHQLLQVPDGVVWIALDTHLASQAVVEHHLDHLARQRVDGPPREGHVRMDDTDTKWET